MRLASLTSTSPNRPAWLLHSPGCASPRSARREVGWLLPAGDCDSGARAREWTAAGQNAHALPMQTPEQKGPGRADAHRPLLAPAEVEGDTRSSRDAEVRPRPRPSIG